MVNCCEPRPYFNECTNADINRLSCYYTEFYKRFIPSLTYKVLSLEESLRDAFYGDSPTSARQYDPVTSLNIRPQEYPPEEQLFEEYMIDKRHQMFFYLPKPLFDVANIIPKIGDVIIWDNLDYEIRTVVRSEESYMAHLNIFFEWIAMTERPSQGL